MNYFDFYLIEKHGEEVQRAKIGEETIEFILASMNIDSRFDPKIISEMIDIVNAVVNYLQYVPEVVLEQVQREHTQKMTDRGFKKITKSKVRFSGDVGE